MKAPRPRPWMALDPTTLSDLEIFGSPETGRGLLGLLEGTWTRVGADHLRLRLERPLTDPEEIQRVQDTLRALGTEPVVRIQDSEVVAVQRYLQSNILLSLPRGRFQALRSHWAALRWGSVYRELREAVWATFLFLDRLRTAVEGARERGELPAGLKGWVDEVEALVEDLPTERPAGVREVLLADRYLRKQKASRLDRLVALVGEMDALQAMAEATAREGWTFPDIDGGTGLTLEIEALVHPTLPDAVANPFSLGSDGRLVFLTGPNMAGKTTLMRSVGLAVVMAQAGLGVPARSMRLTPMEVLFTSLNPRDNLRAGLSYFLAEVRRVRQGARWLASGRRGLFLFDEVFKGTNLRDALEASVLVIRGFARARRSGAIFASHLVELVPVLEDVPGIRFQCFEGEVEDGQARYSYRVRDGHSEQRFGLLLLRQEGVPDLLGEPG